VFVVGTTAAVSPAAETSPIRAGISHHDFTISHRYFAFLVRSIVVVASYFLESVGKCISSDVR